MKAKIYVGAKKYALYIGRKIVQKTLEFLTLPARFVSKKVQDLKNYLIYGNSVQDTNKPLPSGYTRLQYIESTTDQYIDTEVKGELGSELTFVGQLTKYNTAQDYGHLWGDLQDNTMAVTFNTPKTTSKTASSRFGDKSTSSSTSTVKVIPLNTPVTIIQNKDGATATTGFEIAFGTTAEFTTVNSLYLFSTATSTGASTATHKWRCEYYSHKKNGVLVQELIPCKNSQGVVGMYDTISGKFFASKSDTSFVAGGDYVPTPDTPVEIESVGVRTKNLFSGDTEIYGLEVGKTYTISFTTDSGRRRNVYAYDKDGTQLIRVFTASSIQTGYLSGSFVLPENTEYLSFQAFITLDYETLQLEEGSQATPYEPYSKYKIPVTVGGKNLFDNKNANYRIDDAGSLVVDTGSKCTDFIPVNYNDVYTASCLGSGGTSTTAWICVLYDKDKNFISGTRVTNVSNLMTITVNKEDAKYLRLCKRGAGVTNVQLELGSTTTEYTPYIQPTTTNIYLEQPLRKIGEVSDYIDFENKKVVRNIGENIVKGADVTAFSQGNYASRMTVAKLQDTTRDNISTPFASNSFTWQGFSSGGGRPNMITSSTITTVRCWLWFENGLFTDTTTGKAYVDTLNIIIYNVLAIPTEETIDLPTINLLQGTLMIDTDTNIKPSKIIITGDIDNE